MEDENYVPRRTMTVNLGALHDRSYSTAGGDWHGKNSAPKLHALRDKLAACYHPDRRAGRATQKEAYRKDWYLRREGTYESQLWTHAVKNSTEARIMSEVCHDIETQKKHLSNHGGRWWFTRNFEEWGKFLNKDECTLRRAVGRLVAKGLLIRRRFHMKDHGIRTFLRPDLFKVLAVRTRHFPADDGYNTFEYERADNIIIALPLERDVLELMIEEARDLLHEEGGVRADFNFFDAFAEVMRKFKLEPDIGDFPLVDRPVPEELAERRKKAATVIEDGGAGRTLARMKKRNGKITIPAWVQSVLNNKAFANAEVEALESACERFDSLKNREDKLAALVVVEKEASVLRARLPRAVEISGYSAKPKRRKSLKKPLRAVAASNHLDCFYSATSIASSVHSGETPDSNKEVVNAPTPIGAGEVSSFQSDTSPASSVVGSVESAVPALCENKIGRYVRLLGLALAVLREARRRNLKFDRGCSIKIPSSRVEGGWVSIFGVGSFDPFAEHYSRRGLFSICVQEGRAWLTTELDINLPEEAGYEEADLYVKRYSRESFAGNAKSSTPDPQLATTPAIPA